MNAKSKAKIETFLEKEFKRLLVEEYKKKVFITLFIKMNNGNVALNEEDLIFCKQEDKKKYEELIYKMLEEHDLLDARKLTYNQNLKEFFDGILPINYNLTTIPRASTDMLILEYIKDITSEPK